LREQHWLDWLARHGAHALSPQELPARLEGTALALSNQRFFSERIAHRAKAKGLRVIWSSEMMWHHPGELDAVAEGVVDCVLYNSEFNREALQGAYLSRKPGLAQNTIGNYVDPEQFPLRTRASGSRFCIGRLSRPDPLKYPADFPAFYEGLGLRAPSYRVMAWSTELAARYRHHRFGSDWQLLSPNQESQLDFLSTLDAFVFPLGEGYREAWGRAVVEAMLTGLPVVVPTGHHFGSYLLHGETGFVCDEREEWARACRALEDAPALRLAVGRAAHAFARDVLCDRATQLLRWREVFHA